MNHRSSPAPGSISSTFTAQPNMQATTSHTIEVVTMLGDSVLGVTHLAPATRARARTPAFIAIGAGVLLLLLAALSFGRGVAVAAENQRALAHWRDTLGRPVHEFRPARLHAAHDWALLGGLACGLAALSWGALRLRARGPRHTFLIGTDRDADVSIDRAPLARFPLVRWHGAAPVVCVPEGMRARLHRAGRSYEIDELAALGMTRPAAWSDAGPAGAREIDVPGSGSLRVDIGPTGFVIRQTAAIRARSLPGVALPDPRSMGFWVASAAAHVALLALLQAIPPEPGSLAIGLDGPASRRTTRVSWKPSEAERVTDLSRDPDTAGGDRRVGGVPEAGGREAGTEQRTGGGPVRPMPAQPGASSREEAVRMARRSGMLAFLGNNPGSFDPIGTIGTTGSFDTEEGVIDAYGTPVGLGPGSTWGSFGTGTGGFGVDGGTVSSGRYGTIGWPGMPGPAGPGVPGPDLEPRRRAGFGGPTVKLIGAKVVGGIDSSIIRRHIQRRHERIRHCYERALLTAPGLEGTVVARFVISPAGAVLDASATGVGHGGLTSCISGVIQGISFPRNSSGELARVTYPFELRNTGR